LDSVGTQPSGILKLLVEELHVQYIYGPSFLSTSFHRHFLFQTIRSVFITYKCSPTLNILLDTCSFYFDFVAMRLKVLSILGALLLPALVTAQLSGHVGPTTTREAKRSKKVCNILDYGGVASKTSDIGPPISSAFAACKTGGTGTPI
jgi:hypothetical protein